MDGSPGIDPQCGSCGIAAPAWNFPSSQGPLELLKVFPISPRSSRSPWAWALAFCSLQFTPWRSHHLGTTFWAVVEQMMRPGSVRCGGEEAGNPGPFQETSVVLGGSGPSATAQETSGACAESQAASEGQPHQTHPALSLLSGLWLGQHGENQPMAQEKRAGEAAERDSCELIRDASPALPRAEGTWSPPGLLLTALSESWG